MLLRPNIRTPDGRIRVGVSNLLVGIVFDRAALLPPVLNDNAFWNGLVHGLTAVFIGFGLFLGVSGAGALANRRWSGVSPDPRTGTFVTGIWHLAAILLRPRDRSRIRS